MRSMDNSPYGGWQVAEYCMWFIMLKRRVYGSDHANQLLIENLISGCLASPLHYAITKTLSSLLGQCCSRASTASYRCMEYFPYNEYKDGRYPGISSLIVVSSLSPKEVLLSYLYESSTVAFNTYRLSWVLPPKHLTPLLLLVPHYDHAFPPFNRASVSLALSFSFT